MTEPVRDEFDDAACGLLTTSPDGRIQSANTTFVTLCGYSKDELVGRRRFEELLSTGGRIYHETHYAPMLRMQGAAREIALDLVRSDGTRVPVLVNSVVLHDAAGNPLLVRTAVFEATHRRQYERELLRAKQRAEASDARATALARTLQRTLIPPAIPDIEGLDVAAVFRPAADGEVGGDFYDVFQLATQTWALAIGDVCGKGPEAAVVTALARFTLRAEAMRYPLPSGSLGALNEVLNNFDTDRFITATFGELTRDGERWTGRMCCGGHPLPLLRHNDGTIDYAAEPGTLLGVVPKPDLHDSPVALDPGDALVLYTDGVLEARVGEDFYGEDRLRTALGGPHATATELVDAVLGDVLSSAGSVLPDDVAVVVVRVPD